MILMIQVGFLGVTQCNHPLTAVLASKMHLTLKPDPTAQLFYRVLVITEGKREGRRGEAIPNPAIKLQGLPGSPFPALEGT